jgi:aminoglycoside phosphotransferase (APT) family kinase protein
MSTQPLLPTAVADLLAAAFPGQPLAPPAPTVGGFSNLSLLLKIGGRPCVVKTADREPKRADLRREARVLQLLAGRRLGAPELLACLEDACWTVLALSRRPGAPGISLYGGPPEALLAPLRALGRALARLHGMELTPPGDAGGAGLLLADRAATLASMLPGLPLPDELRAALGAALAHPAWRRSRPRLVHGDAGLHNVLWGHGRLSLLDWELAGWGDPRLDLAWAAWTLSFRGMPAACLGALLDGYGRGRAAALSLDPQALFALALGQIAALSARAAGGPAWEEWLRRARWTIAGGPALLSLLR